MWESEGKSEGNLMESQREIEENSKGTQREIVGAQREHQGKT